MIEFTKEEISLCKKVANTGERRALRFGDFWFMLNDEQRIHVVSKETAVISLMEQQVIGCFPLWTISDCLEFFERKSFNLIFSFIHFENRNWTFTAETSILNNHYQKARGEKAKTKLEACLKAVLAVLEEGK